MIKFNTLVFTLTLGLVFTLFSPMLNANTLQNNIDQQLPAEMNAKQRSSLKTAIQEVKLLPSAGGGVEHRFGNSVSVDGNRMIVGAPNYSLNTIVHGAVYVFDYDGSKWNESQILTPFDGNNGDQFGVSVSLSGTRLLIGANKDDDASTDAGVVFVYDFNGVSWQFDQKLIANDAAAGFKFGASVSLSGDRALIGSDRAINGNDFNRGAAYIFDLDNNLWSQTAKLLASDADDHDSFGESVSLFANRALIGNSTNEDAGNDSGSATIFEFDGINWLETQKLTANDAGFLHKFGSAVSLSSNTALIGAIGEGSNGSNTGAVYVFSFNNNTWTQTQKLQAADNQANAKFGQSVSLQGNRVLITAVGDLNTGAAYVFDFNGSVWNQSQKLTASDATPSDQFGFSASLSNNRLVIGAHLDDSNGDNSGSVYVFDNNGSNWSQTDKVLAVAGNSSVGDRFGTSVSISGNRALVGALGEGSLTGAAYIFDFDGASWNLTQKIQASDSNEGDRFGTSVSLSGNRALVGAILDDNNGILSGSAYIFNFDGINWNQTQKIKAADGDGFDQFGISVSLSGNRALVGASSDDDNGDDSGSAYIFDFNGTIWNQTQKIKAGDGDISDFFGRSVSLFGNRALIGAREDDDNGVNSGSAYIFDFDGTNWNQTQKIKASDGEAGDFFGTAVSLSGNRVLVGVPFDDDNGSASGAAYIFDFNETNWIQSHKLTAFDGNDGYAFGISVSLSGDRALIGSSSDNSIAINAGSAYAYDFDGSNWNLTQKLTASDIDFDDRFGKAVSILGNRVLIGAIEDDDNGTDSGSAYIFTDINDLIFENGFEN